MSDNSLKVPFAQSMAATINEKAAQAIGNLGLSLPCSVVAVNGSIVTVNFLIQQPVTVENPFTLPNVTCPIFGPEWIRYPVQVGDLGFVVPADAYLGGVSGLGGTMTADLSQPSNLGALVFFPIGNKNFAGPLDANKLELYGKTGVVIKDKQGGNVLIDIDDSGNITITLGGGGDLVVNGVSFLHHVHTGVQTGGGNSGPPL